MSTGFIGDGGIDANPYCTACSVNTYKTATSNSTCTACPTDSNTNALTGSQSISACLRQPGFTANSDPNATPFCQFVLPSAISSNSDSDCVV